VADKSITADNSKRPRVSKYYFAVLYFDTGEVCTFVLGSVDEFTYEDFVAGNKVEA